jgi:putative transposase
VVSDPSLYPWSSFGVHVGNRRSQLVRDHGVFLSLGKNDASRSSAYLRLFESELTDDTIREIREATRKSRPLGNRQFEAAINSKLDRTPDSKPWGGARRRAGRPKGVR